MSTVGLEDLKDALLHLGLDGAAPLASDAPLVVARDVVDEVLSAPPHEGLVALLGAAIDQGSVLVDGPSRDAVTAAWTEAMARCVQLDALLHDVAACLTAAGVEHRALKGAAVAHLDELSPAWRSYADVDVLVPDDSLLIAARALERLQLRPLVAPVSERWAQRYAKSLTLVHPSGVQVDLHRLLSPGVLGERVQSTALFASGQAFTVGTATIMALSAPHRLLHACYHASLGGVRGVRHRRDVLLLAHSVDVAEVADRWHEGWSPVVVADALDAANATGAALPPEWAEWRRTVVLEPDDRALLATYSGTFGDQAGASARSGGPWAALQYSWPLFWPSRAHLRSRSRSRTQHLRGVFSPRVVRMLRRRTR